MSEDIDKKGFDPIDVREFNQIAHPQPKLTVIRPKAKPAGKAAPEVEKLEQDLQPGGLIERLLGRDNIKFGSPKPPRK